jgi:hypothetical protein
LSINTERFVPPSNRLSAFFVLLCGNALVISFVSFVCFVVKPMQHAGPSNQKESTTAPPSNRLSVFFALLCGNASVISFVSFVCFVVKPMQHAGINRRSIETLPPRE